MKKLLFILMLLLLVGIASAQTVSTSSVTSYISGTATTQVYLSTAPAGYSGSNITITASNASVVSFTAITLPSWASVSTSSGIPGSTVTFLQADASNVIVAGQTNILLATITTKGLAVGTSAIQVRVNEVDDEVGNPVSPTVSNGTATIQSTVLPARPAASATINPVDTTGYVALVGAIGGNYTPQNETDAVAMMNWTGIIEAGMMPFTTPMGVIAWFILLAIPFIMIWIVHGKAWVPLILGVILGSTLVGFGWIPAEYTGPILAFIALSIGGIVYVLYTKER